MADWLRVDVYLKAEDMSVIHDSVEAADQRRVVYEGSVPLTFVRFGSSVDLSLFVLGTPGAMIADKSSTDCDVLLSPMADVGHARELLAQIVGGRGEILEYRQVVLFAADRKALDDLNTEIRARDHRNPIIFDVAGDG